MHLQEIKKEMDLIIEEAKLSNGLFVIIDEIHRMNKNETR